MTDTLRPLRSTLDNGLRVLSAHHHGESAAIAVWLHNGCRHEGAGESGFAHRLEHAWFGDTQRRDAAALRAAIARAGGQFNAQCGRELSALYARVPRSALPEALKLLCEMVAQPQLDAGSLAAEAAAIAIEQGFDGASRLDDACFARLWPGHPLARPACAPDEGSEGPEADAIARYQRAVTCGKRMLVAVVGNIAHENVVDACGTLGTLPAGERPLHQPPPATPQARSCALPGLAPRLRWMLPCPGWTDPELHVTLLAADLLGGGMHSRLYQALRVDRHLVYGVAARPVLFQDAGALVIDIACEAASAPDCRQEVEQAIHGLIAHGPTVETLQTAIAGMQARLSLEDDDPFARMQRLAMEAHYLGRHPSLAERHDELAALHPAAVSARLRQIWTHRLELIPAASP